MRFEIIATVFTLFVLFTSGCIQVWIGNSPGGQENFDEFSRRADAEMKMAEECGEWFILECEGEPHEELKKAALDYLGTDDIDSIKEECKCDMFEKLDEKLKREGF